MTDTSYDIAIVGGGPVGLTMAVALTRSMRGLKVALLDRRPFSIPSDQRASAIAAGVRRIFVELGVWPAMSAGAEPVRQMKITDSGTGDISRPLFLSFIGDVAPGEPFAHLVPNRLIAETLLGALGPDVEIIAPVEITGFAAGPAIARLSLADGRTIAAPLVIASDGAQSALRRMAGIEVIAHDYGQSGLVTTITHELDHEGTAYEHFRPAGPFASLPLPGRRSSLVWTESNRRAAELKTLPPAEIAAEIETAMGSSLGRVTLDEGLQAFPLKLQIARSFTAPRLALIGDAAHVVHPVAGQGLNLGLKDVAALAEVVIDAIRLGQDHGAPENLERYQQWRRFDTALMAMVTDGMVRLFSNDIAPVRALRDLGMGLVDRLPPVKDALIARAAGLDRHGPKLLRGLQI
ncbi:MAG: 2-octaprenyl-6-methoxyphenol hydroxylase [Devosia sp.]|uniref:FAD-dependent monooxygenase n=1 Tax=Devosia sp. TaxID=1871048 RepID=UPI00260E6907|nr:FAD-dependent monooxygenase [Devosia sp.]MDB5541921.1 2-octaprenyl-6-methoxyphenol hydroxylase [Devosia sp.]